MKRSTKKHQQILDAAVNLFKKAHDVKKVSLEAIAREARVSPTTIYNHFSTREALVTEVAKTLLKEILDMARSFMRSDLPFPRKLTDIIAGKIDIVSQVNREVFNKLLSQDETMTGFIEEIYRKEIAPMWLEFIDEGKRQGYIDPSTDGTALIVYFDILRAGIASMSHLTREWEKNMPVIEQLTHLMFYGFLKKEVDLFQKEAKETHD